MRALTGGSDRRAGALELGLIALGALATATLATYEWYARVARVATPAEVTRVEIGGCCWEGVPPACTLPPDRRLTAWVRGARPDQVRLLFDGDPASAEVSSIQDGARAQAVAPKGARQWVIAVVKAQGDAIDARRVTLSDRAEHPSLADANRLKNEGRLAEATAALGALSKSDDIALRARAIGTQARIELRSGKIQRALELFEESVALKERSHLISEAERDRSAQIHTLIMRQNRFSDASRVIAELQKYRGVDDFMAADYPYCAGVLAYQTGDLRTALRSFREAASAAERTAHRQQRLDSIQMEASTLARLGRASEARALLLGLLGKLSHDQDACTYAMTLENIGWFAMDATEETDESAASRADTVLRLKEAFDIHQTTCGSPIEIPNDLSNLAMAKEIEGDLDGAKAYLDRSRRVSPKPDAAAAAQWADIEGRIALRANEPKRALEAFKELERIAASSLLPEMGWRGALGRARALDALHDVEGADKAFREAEEKLDDESLLAPLGEGRSSYLSRFESSARLRIDFLLRSKREMEAAQAARLSRARILLALRSIDSLAALSIPERRRWEDTLTSYRQEREAADAEARDDWRLPATSLRKSIDERTARLAKSREAIEHALMLRGTARARVEDLWSPREGELMLVYHPLPSGWAAFALERDRVKTRRIERLDLHAPPSDLAAALLGAFEEEIGRAKRIRLAPYGQLEAIDLHALPWHGEPLGAAAIVAYATDIGDIRTEPAPNPPTAVLIADPRSDLPGAWQEAQAVATTLRAQRYRVELLDRGRASYAAVRKALERPEVALLHYAGHGAFAGHDGWDSAFALAGDGWFTVADVLALEHVPSVVVLAACESARADETRGEAFGIGKAFLVSGSRAVIAAQRPIKDQLAKMMMDRLHQHALGDPAGSLHDAQRAIMRDAPDADWAAFRALVR